jgi:uncharacterized protein
MANESFDRTIQDGYSFSGPSILVGAPLLEGAVRGSARVRLPLGMLNRHGLIAGATGTGKTRTVELLAEELSESGVPVFVADLKGDLSGLGAAGTANPRLEERAREIGVPFAPVACPVEFLSLSGSSGIPLRATVSSFGPLLLSRALGLNETQRSTLALVFQYCDAKGLLLLDLTDLKAVLTHLTGAGSADLAQYGALSKASVGVLLRKVTELEQQGADRFFGEPEFEVEDLLRLDGQGRGIVSILELKDVQERPALFTTFLMWLLASLYRELPEVGDPEKPKLVFFFDEAHLLFEEASKPFLAQVEQVVRLIRSKGVGIFFVTQTPKDIPDEILGQLGNRIQHALRAFTPDDEKALRAAANTFPRSPFYDVPKTLLSMGTGEALVTGLSPQGTPTPLAWTRIAPPRTQMTPIAPEEIEARVRRSALEAEYATPLDRESAREVLEARASHGEAGAPPAEMAKSASRSAGGRTQPTPPNFMEQVGKALSSPAGRTIERELVRGLLGVLGVRAAARRRTRW